MRDSYKDLIDSIYDGVYFVDRKRRITFWNKSAERITGYKSAEVLGKPCFHNILDHINEAGECLCHNGCPLHKTLKDGKFRESDIFLRQKNGQRRSVSVRVSPVRDENGKITGAVEIFNDNSSKMAVIEQLQAMQDMAYLDHLTNICNRRSIETYLSTKFDEFQSYGWPFGIALIDVDNFKSVNDTYGHDAGDSILKMIAGQLSAHSRALDIAGRWGGEEFLIILSNVTKRSIYQIAERLRIMIEKSHVRFEKTLIKVTISAGLTMAKTNDTIKSLVKRSDDLLLECKNTGKNKVQFG